MSEIVSLKKLEYLSCPQTAPTSAAASLEGTRRNHKGLSPDASVWMACTPSLEDLWQAGVDLPLSIGCHPLLHQDRGRMTGFGEEDHYHLFGSAQLLEFHRCPLSHLEKATLKTTAAWFVCCVSI